MDDPQVIEIATHTINILRVAEGHRQAAVQRLTELQGEITTLLEKSEKLSPNRLSRLQALQEQTDESIAQAYQDISGKHQKQLKQLAKVEAKKAQGLVNTKIGVDVVSVAIPEKLLEAVVDGPHIFGNSAKEWWNGQADDLKQKFKTGMQQGVLLGETVDQLAARVRGTKANEYNDGMMAAKRREAQALVRSSAISIANEARLRQFEEMDDLVKGVQWVATLDTRTTPQCRALDGKMWRLPDYEPVGHDKAWPGPTAHWNCRSTQIAVLRSWEELSGKELPTVDDKTLEAAIAASLKKQGWSDEKIAKAKANTRASMDGQVADDVDFEKWLRLQPPERVEAILGPGRKALWDAGELTVSDMTDQTNRPLTIEQLEKIVETGTPAPETLGVQFLPLVSESADLTAKTTAELNKVASAEIEAIQEAAEEQPEELPPAEPDTSAETIAAILASPAGQTLKAKWIAKIQKENPEMAPKDVLANATQQALMEQASKSKAAALSVAKKKLLAGQDLTPALKKTIDSLTPEELANFNDSVETAKALAQAKKDAEDAKIAAEEAAKLAAKKAEVVAKVTAALSDPVEPLSKYALIPPSETDILTPSELAAAFNAGDAIQKAAKAAAKKIQDAKDAYTKAAASANINNALDAIPKELKDLLSPEEKSLAMTIGYDQKKAKKAATIKAVTDAVASGGSDQLNLIPGEDLDLLTGEEYADAIAAGEAQKLGAAQGPLDYSVVELTAGKAKAQLLQNLYDQNPGPTNSAFDNIETAITADDALVYIQDKKTDKILGAAGYVPSGKNTTLLEIQHIGSLTPGAGTALVKELAKKSQGGMIIFDPYPSSHAFWLKLGFEPKPNTTAWLLTMDKTKALAAAPPPDPGVGPTPPPPAATKPKKKTVPLAKTKEQAIQKLKDAAAIGKPLPKALKPSEMKLIPAQELADIVAQLQPAPGVAPTPPVTVQAPKQHSPNAITPPTPPERIPAEFPTKAAEVSALKVVKRLGGSTGAELVEYKGKQYVRKKGASVDHVRSEFIADRVYEALGLDVPQGALYEDGGKVWKLTEFREGKELGRLSGSELAAATKAFRQGFVADVLLGNWDVLGAGKDNVLWDGKNLVRIDNGGSLNFRAMGTPKTQAEWTAIPREIFTMRDRGTAPQVAELMQGVDLHALAPTLQALRPEALDLVEMPTATRDILKERIRHLRDLGNRAVEFAANDFDSGYTELHAKSMFDLRERQTDLNLMGDTTRSGTFIADAATGRNFGNLRASTSGTRPAASLLPGDVFGPKIEAAFKTINHKLNNGNTNYNQTTLAAATALKPDILKMQKSGTAEQKVMATQYLEALDKIDAKVKAAAAGDLTALPIFETYKPKKATPTAPAPTISVVDDLHKMLQNQGVPEAAIALHEKWNTGQGGNSWNKNTLIAKYWMSQVARKAPQDHHYWNGNNVKRSFKDAKDAWDEAVKQYGQENVEKVFAAHHALMMEQLERVNTDYVDRENRVVLLLRTESAETLKANGIDTKKVKAGDVIGLRLGATESHSMIKPTYVMGQYLTAKIVPFSRVLYNHWFEPSAGSGWSGFLGDYENEWAADTSGIPSALLATSRVSDHPIKPSSNKADWIKAGVPDYSEEFTTGKK